MNNKVIYFLNDDQHKDYCAGQVYYDFLDYAFEKTDYFMLVYINYYGKGYTKQQKYIKNALNKYKVKSRSNPSWPGTLQMECPNTTYKIVFYKNQEEAKAILKEVNCLSDWSGRYPEDLAFFKGNQCWFYSVGHEMIAAIIHADKNDIDFLEANGLAKRKNAFIPDDNYFDAYDELIEP